MFLGLKYYGGVTLLKSNSIFSLLVVIFLIAGMILFGTTGINASPRSLSMGGVGVIDSGVSAVYWNPGAVHFDNVGMFSIDLGFAGGAGNNLLAYNEILELFDEDLEEDDFLDLLEEIDRDLSIYGDFTGGIKLRVGPINDFTGSASLFAGGAGVFSSNIPADLFDVLDIIEELEEAEEEDFEENDFEEISFVADGTEFGGGIYTDFGANLSYDVTELLRNNMINEGNEDLDISSVAIGGNLRYMSGLFGSAAFNGNISIEEEIIDEIMVVINGEDYNLIEYMNDDNNDDENDVLEVPLPHGDLSLQAQVSEKESAGGLAFDLGIFTEINDRINLGFSARNIIGSLSTGRADIMRYELLFDKDEFPGKLEYKLQEIIDEEGYEEPEDITEDDFTKAVEQILEDGITEEEIIGDAAYRLPLILSAGGSMEVAEDLRVASSLTYASHSIGANDLQLSLGTESQHLDPLHLRGGINYSSRRGGFKLSAGAGLAAEPFTADLAISGLGAVFGNARDFEAGLSMGLEF